MIEKYARLYSPAEENHIIKHIQSRGLLECDTLFYATEAVASCGLTVFNRQIKSFVCTGHTDGTGWKGTTMYLYHYFDKSTGPFMNLSELSDTQANAVLEEIKRTKPNVQSAQRDRAYMLRRRMYEEILRTEFLKKGGIIKRHIPHYFVVEHSPWLSTWFENCGYIRIPIENFDLTTVSFTYGDSHPVFSPWPRKDDWKEYRRKLYTYEEILEIIHRYGLPQDWNGDGRFGPERYIEAHVWSDEPAIQYRMFFA